MYFFYALEATVHKFAEQVVSHAVATYYVHLHIFVIVLLYSISRFLVAQIVKYCIQFVYLFIYVWRWCCFKFAFGNGIHYFANWLQLCMYITFKKTYFFSSLSLTNVYKFFNAILFQNLKVFANSLYRVLILF